MKICRARAVLCLRFFSLAVGLVPFRAAATELKPGLEIEAHLAPGEAHTYSVALAAGDFISLLVLKKGVAVTVTLSNSAGTTLVSADASGVRFGPVRLLALVTAADNFALRVSPQGKDSAAGSYVLDVVRMGPAEDADRSQLSAEALLHQAADLAKDRKWSEAEETLKRALEIDRAIGDKLGQANALTALADALTESGRDADAIPSYAEAAVLFKDQRDSYNEAMNRFNCGLNQLGIGEKQEALHSLQDALALFEATDSKTEQAITLHQIGNAHWALGERQKVLEYFERALEIHKATGDQAGEARTLNSIGAFYYNINDNDRALDYFRRALKIDRKLGQPKQMAVTLYNIGERFRYLKDYAKALASFDEALTLARAAADRAQEARILASMGSVLAAQGNTAKAVESVDSSVEMAKELRDTAVQAEALSKSGMVLHRVGRDAEALDRLHQSLELDRQREYAPGEALTLFRMAAIERSQDRLQQARGHVEESIAIIEGVWSHIATPEWGSLYLSSKKDIYDLYVDILMSLHQRDPQGGYAAAGFVASERMRARTLLDLLSESKVDLRSQLDPELLAREKSLNQSIARAVQKQASAARLPSSQQEQSGREVARLLEEYESVEGRLRDSNPRYGALMRAEPVTVDRIQEALDSDTVLLEYSLGESRSFAWAIARDRVESFVLPASAGIADLARNVYSELQKQPEVASAAVRLSQVLLKPLAGELGPKRIVVVADGPLEYIPFAALPDPARPNKSLLSRHEVVHLPSVAAFLALAGLQPSPATGKRLAIFADPVFDPGDARVAGAVSRAAVQDSVLGLSLPRLPFSRQEALSISGLVPPPERKEALGFEATRALFLSPDVGQYKIIHLATHAVLNTEHPDLSGIVLSEVDPSGKPIDGVIRLLDLYQMRIQADLVVLSACETALGKEVRGEGLVGLTRGFMYAGAPRVVASLWKVDDHATAELMRIFYNAMLGPAKLRPAAALRSAQITLSHNPRWASPYYWGAFVLEGDWR